MAKKIVGFIKLQCPAGKANPSPPIGPALGQRGLNIMEFCKQFNAQTASRKGETVPVVVTIYTDRTFSFVLKTPPTSELIKKRANVSKGSARPKTDKVGTISWKDVEEIVKIKFSDLNAFDMEQAKKIIAGSARSMGIKVE